MSIKVVITDDHPMLLSGLKHTLSKNSNITIMGTFANGKDLLQFLQSQQPDILLLDLQLPEFPGKAIAQEVLKLYPDIKILIISSQEDSFIIDEMIQLGCVGYLPKSSTDHNQLLEAIETVHYGELYLEPSLKKDLMTNIIKGKRKSEKTMAMLTQKEKEILKFIVEGHSSKKIADHLGISFRTVETHRFSLLQKLEVKNAAELVKKAMELHLLK